MSKRKAPQEAPLRVVTLEQGGQGLLTGCRIPRDYFVTTGFGECGQGGGIDPWETGSLDKALEDAGIENANIVPYTSVLPRESREISQKAAQRYLHHGQVLECIQARMNGQEGDRISAGVGRMHVRRRRDGARMGGFAAEYEGHATEDAVREILKRDLEGIFNRRYSEEEYEVEEEQYTVRCGEVKEAYGSVLASICFVSYILPIHPPEDEDERKEGDGGAGQPQAQG